MKHVRMCSHCASIALYFAFLVVSICWSPVSLAAPEYRSFYGPYGSSLQAVAAFSDGSIAGLGHYNTSSGGADAALLLFDPTGNLSVSTAWGGSGSDSIETGLFTASGDILMGGMTDSFGVPAESQLLMRISNAGTLQWGRTMSFTAAASLSAMARTSTGDIYTCGTLQSTPGPMPIYFTVSRLSESGALQWCTALDDGYFNFWASSIAATTDGGCIASGSIGSTGIENLVVFKFLADGSLDWRQYMSAPFYMDGISIHEVTDGFIIGVKTLSLESNLCLVKLDSSGGLVWARAYSETGSLVNLNSLVETGDGGYTGTGMIMEDGSSDSQSLIFQTSLTGALEWAYRIGDQLDGDTDTGYGLTVLPSGEIAIAGYRQVYAPLRGEMLLIRTRADGVVPGCDRVEPVVLTSTDVTSDLYVYTRTVTAGSITPTVTDVTASMVMQTMDLTEIVHCNGIDVPALSGVGVFILLILTGLLIRTNR